VELRGPQTLAREALDVCLERRVILVRLGVDADEPWTDNHSRVVKHCIGGRCVSEHSKWPTYKLRRYGRWKTLR
jgi:hypothetical protein